MSRDDIKQTIRKVAGLKRGHGHDCEYDFEELYKRLELSVSDMAHIESPYAGNVERNEKYAERACYDAIEQGYIPFASHLFYTRFLDDTVEVERKIGMACGQTLMEHCDINLVYTDYGISEGMQQGIEKSNELGLDVRFISIGENND